MLYLKASLYQSTVGIDTPLKHLFFDIGNREKYQSTVGIDTPLKLFKNAVNCLPASSKYRWNWYTTETFSASFCLRTRSSKYRWNWYTTETILMVSPLMALDQSTVGIDTPLKPFRKHLSAPGLHQSTVGIDTPLKPFNRPSIADKGYQSTVGIDTPLKLIRVLWWTLQSYQSTVGIDTPLKPSYSAPVVTVSASKYRWNWYTTETNTSNTCIKHSIIKVPLELIHHWNILTGEPRRNSTDQSTVGIDTPLKRHRVALFASDSWSKYRWNWYTTEAFMFGFRFNGFFDQSTVGIDTPLKRYLLQHLGQGL